MKIHCQIQENNTEGTEVISVQTKSLSVNNIPMRCRSKTDGCKARGAANGHSIGKPSNAADAVFDRNPQGQADLRAFRCRKPLVVNDTTARLAPGTTSQIGSVALAYY